MVWSIYAFPTPPPWEKVLAGSINNWLSELSWVNVRLTVVWGKPDCLTHHFLLSSLLSLQTQPVSIRQPGGLEFCILTVIMEDGKKALSALSLLFRNAAWDTERCSTSSQKSVKRDDDDFHTLDKKGRGDQRTPPLQMLSFLSGTHLAVYWSD